MNKLIVLLLTTYFGLIKTSDVSFTENVKVFTVATEYNDGYERYIRSAKYYGIDVDTLGMGTEWEGGDMKGVGGGCKVNLLKEALKPFKNDDNTIIIFTDSYDVIFTSAIHEIVRKFHTLDAKIVFGAEHYCWPDETLKTKYPSTIAQGARYLNSGMFMGYASHIYGILENPIENDGDDQLYYTQAFLNEEIRKKHNIKLDHKSEIFQNLNGAIDDVKLDVDPRSGDGILQNINFMTVPSIIHGNGPSKIYLNAFANYLAGTYENKECKICTENHIKLEKNKLPIVSIAVFVERAMPFLEEFFDGILAIDYPKDKINLFVHNNVPYHEDVVTKFVDKIGKEYKTIKVVTPTDKIEERDARKLAVHQADVRKSDYLFVIDAEAHIDDDAVLKDLISYNRSFIAPILTRPTELWSNFWGAISDTGYYARSHDYLDIVKGNLRGMWNVPYVSSMYLVKKSVFPKMSFEHDKLDPDMALCENLREKGIFMNVINTEEYGHLINNDDFDTKLTSPDLYTLFTNKADWERRYIHPDYIELLSPNFTFNQPCPDVYWFPIVTEKFCTEFVAIMEAFGKWSDGTNQDSRLEGGYEAVPTRDIHMNQVGLDPLWLKFLYYYVRPLQELVFTGYYHNPPRSLMNFVVRYRPDEQPSLRPHHDSSTYTINIALNSVGVDYEGGGCKFLRYNCSVTATKMGWMLMHPGRLTHFHEGLRTISGTRYIMISFVDP